jgi:hypothetical protein
MEGARQTEQRRGEKALTIAEAVREGNGDIIAAVVRISIDAVQARAQLLMADQSIPFNAYARVSLRGASVSSLADVSVGNVLRFNGLVMTNHESVRSPLVGDFRSSWQDTGWTRLYQQATTTRVHHDRIQELIDWFSASKYNDSIPALPRRRRRLSELDTPGIVCHVVARIASFDTAAGEPQTRKRSQAFAKKTTFAVLSDGNEVMPFMNCDKYETILKTAMSRGQEVLLTNVVSSLAGTGANHVVLKPTNTTSVVPMCLTDTNRNLPARHAPPDCLTLTQEEVPGTYTQTISSPLRDIYIDELGISLGAGKHFLSPIGFISTIIDNNNRRYRQATLTLDGIVVKADSSTMQALCGSVEAASMWTHTSLRRYVMELIRALLDDEVNLSWSLEQQRDNSYQVTKCVLPIL